MKRWLLIPAAAAMFATGCDKEEKSAPKRAPAQASAFSAETPAVSGAALDAINAATTRQTDVLAGAANASELDGGRRLFDGQILRANGFAAADDASVAVPPGAGRGPRPLSPYSGSPARRARDLDAAAPPAPAYDAYPPSPESVAAGAGKVLGSFDAFQRDVFDQVAPILSRAGWGAAKRKGSPVAMKPTHVTVHHTEGPQTMTEAQTAAAIKSIQYYHMRGRAKEGKDVWDDIGYHFLIDGSGRVAEGRPAETLGAHAGGANQNNIGISMMGNFNRQTPTPAQIESLTRLVSFLAIKYGQNPSRAGFLEPHRHYDQTDCPGKNMMAILAALRDQVNLRTNQITTALQDAPRGKFVPVAVTDA